MSFKTIWVENSPDTLFKLAVKFCLKNRQVFTEIADVTQEVKLRDGLYFPLEISEALFETCQEENSNIDDDFSTVFADTSSTKLSQLTIHSGNLYNHSLRGLLKHNFKKISLNNCPNLTEISLESINEFSDNLLSFHVNNTEKLFPDYLYQEPDDIPPRDEDDEDYDQQESEYERRRYILRAPRLKHLTLRDLHVIQGRNYYNVLCKALPNLTHLDLSGCNSNTGLQKLQFLLNCPNLVSLVLYNVREVKHALNTLCHLDKLEHLDISIMDRSWLWNEIDLEPRFDNPEKYLYELVTSLPHLKSLDISGTNLAEDFGKDGSPDIPALFSRLGNPLEFLGLYKATNEEIGRNHQIPAMVISGAFTEEQLIVAGQRYSDRPFMMECILKDIVLIAKHVAITFDHVQAIMDIAAAAEQKFPRNKKILEMVVIVFYYVLPMIEDKYDQYENKTMRSYNIRVRKKVIGILLGIMERNRNNDLLIKHCFMVIWKLKIPSDLTLLVERTVDLLLLTGEHYSHFDAQDYIQKCSVHLLNMLVCQIYGETKKLVGLRIIDSMLNVIRIKLEKGSCDEVMETAWSVMWNVTDETEANSKRFLDQGGMEMFLECKAAFPESLDLLKNMMGLLGNIAEVRSCRRRLMSPEFIEEFSFLLDSQRDGIEVSYNAAGVMSHIASDGRDRWTVVLPDRAHVLERLVRAVNRWDINSKRNINYRSLVPIIGLLSVTHTRECQLWAAWALANLTLIDMRKYCPLVEQEGGQEAVQNIMEQIIRDSITMGTGSQCEVRQKLLELCQRISHNLLEWKRTLEEEKRLEETGEGLVLLEVDDSRYVIGHNRPA